MLFCKQGQMLLVGCYFMDKQKSSVIIERIDYINCIMKPKFHSLDLYRPFMKV